MTGCDIDWRAESGKRSGWRPRPANFGEAKVLVEVVLHLTPYREAIAPDADGQVVTLPVTLARSGRHAHVGALNMVSYFFCCYPKRSITYLIRFTAGSLLPFCVI